MRYRRLIILILSGLFAAVSFRIYQQNEWGADMPLAAVVTSGEHTEELTCWKDPWNDYYFFLPGFADPATVQIRSESNDEIWIGNHMMTRSGLSCDQFLLNEGYGLARFGWGNRYEGVIRFTQSGNVPTMFIDVPSGNMEYIHQKKGNEESGTMRLYTVDGELCSSGRVESLKGRGNATWNWMKKSYSLTLSEQTDLLDMGEAHRWVLLSNGYDRSNLKNKAAYDLARAAGMAYSPDSQWIDLYLNGEYAGLYLLCERNEVHPERVDISPENSFLISREGKTRLIAQNYPYVDLKLGSFRIHHSSVAQSTMEEMLKSVESALLAEDGMDPRTGKHWTELIDVDSWAEKYLIDEIAANHDGGSISQYFYYDGADTSGKIYAGPVWDMDITFGVDAWYVAPPNNFVARRPSYWDDNYLDDVSYSPFYLLYQKEEFYQRMVEMYQDNFRPALIKMLDSGLDCYAQEISKAVKTDEIRWHTGAPDNITENATETVRTFITERISFLDSLWIRGEKFCDVLLFINDTDPEKNVAAWFAVRPGECLPEIPPELGDWYVCGTNEHFDVTKPVYESVNIYLKEEAASQAPAVGKMEMVSFAIFLTVLAIVLIIDRLRTQRKEMRYK